MLIIKFRHTFLKRFSFFGGGSVLVRTNLFLPGEFPGRIEFDPDISKNKFY